MGLYVFFLQALYCFVWFLVYVDMGLLSSNGVTGTRSTDPSNTSADANSEGGMQVLIAYFPCQSTGVYTLHCPERLTYQCFAGVNEKTLTKRRQTSI